ncbi:MAG: glycosyltransferase, partial [Planctomycetota bacterium]
MVVVTSPISAWCLMRGQLAFLKRAGFDVLLVASPHALLEKTGHREGIRTIAVEMPREPSPWKDIKAILKLNGVIRDESPDILHYSTPKAGLLASLCGWYRGVPTRIYTLRGLRADGFSGAKAWLMRRLERIPLSLSHKNICVSQSLRERAIKLGLAKPDRMTVLCPQSSNGV